MSQQTWTFDICLLCRLIMHMSWSTRSILLRNIQFGLPIRTSSMSLHVAVMGCHISHRMRKTGPSSLRSLWMMSHICSSKLTMPTICKEDKRSPSMVKSTRKSPRDLKSNNCQNRRQIRSLWPSWASVSWLTQGCSTTWYGPLPSIPSC